MSTKETELKPLDNSSQETLAPPLPADNANGSMRSSKSKKSPNGTLRRVKRGSEAAAADGPAVGGALAAAEAGEAGTVMRESQMRNSDGTRKLKKKVVTHRRDHLQNTAFSKRLAAQSTESGMSLSWQNLRYEIAGKGKKKHEKKVILDSISGIARGGHFLAILGASGAGKTSLLNILSGRVRAKDGELSGVIRLNGAPFTMSDLRQFSAFVEQDDIFLPYLTVTETLATAAKLRLGASSPKEERMELVQSIIDELGLSGAANTIVGGASVKGISGGERKRLAIAVAMINDPQVLFLDEPTSGLDAMSALNVVETLCALADAGRTIVATIHQPRSQVFALFDTLLVLSKGTTVYYGDAVDATEYFAKLNYPVPEYTNPADFFLDVCSIDMRGKEMMAATTERVDALIAAYRETPAAAALSTPKPDTEREVALKSLLSMKKRSGSSFWIQLSVLFVRALRNLFRDKARTIARIVQAIVVGVLVALIYFRLGDDQNSIQDRTGVLFFVLLNQSFGSMFMILNTFVKERDVMQRERAAGMYGVLPYYLSKNLAELPMSLVPIVFGAITYFIINLRNTPEAFFTFILGIYLVTFTTESLAFTLAAVSPSVEVATGIAPLILIFFVIFGGFYISLDNIPVWWVWFRYLSFIGYGYESLMVNEFDGRTLVCTEEQYREVFTAEGSIKLCPFTSGDQVYESFDMSKDHLWRNYWILIGMSIAYRLIAYLALRFCYRGFKGHKLSVKMSGKTV